MRCMLASSAAQLLQQQADRPADEVLSELLRRKLRTQAEPNDAGLLAVRVERAGEVSSGVWARDWRLGLSYGWLKTPEQPMNNQQSRYSRHEL